MRKILLLSPIISLLPASVFAQNLDINVANDGFAYASVFAGNFSLLLSIVIGAIATIFVFRAAKRLGGGLFGSVLNYISIGMFLVVLGTISTIVNSWFIGFFNIISTALFATGYIFMVLGANRLFKGIMNT